MGINTLVQNFPQFLLFCLKIITPQPTIFQVYDKCTISLGLNRIILLKPQCVKTAPTVQIVWSLGILTIGEQKLELLLNKQSCIPQTFIFYKNFFLWLRPKFLGSMLPQYMAFSVSFVCRKKFVCPFVGLHCGCVPPL